MTDGLDTDGLDTGRYKFRSRPDEYQFNPSSASLLTGRLAERLGERPEMVVVARWARATHPEPPGPSGRPLVHALYSFRSESVSPAGSSSASLLLVAARGAVLAQFVGS